MTHTPIDTLDNFYEFSLDVYVRPQVPSPLTLTSVVTYHTSPRTVNTNTYCDWYYFEHLNLIVRSPSEPFPDSPLVGSSTTERFYGTRFPRKEQNR